MCTEKQTFPKWDIEVEFDIISKKILVKSYDSSVSADKRMYMTFLKQHSCDVGIICRNLDNNYIALRANSFYLLHVSPKLFKIIQELKSEDMFTSNKALDYLLYTETIIRAAFELIYMKETKVAVEDIDKFMTFIYYEWNLMDLKQYALVIDSIKTRTATSTIESNNRNENKLIRALLSKDDDESINLFGANSDKQVMERSSPTIINNAIYAREDHRYNRPPQTQKVETHRKTTITNKGNK